MTNLWGLLALVAAVVFALMARNVFGDNAEALAAAQRVACTRRICNAELVWEKRRPLQQRFQFIINEKIRKEVLCKRGLWVAGPYGCYEVTVDDR